MMQGVHARDTNKNAVKKNDETRTQTLWVRMQTAQWHTNQAECVQNKKFNMKITEIWRGRNISIFFELAQTDSCGVSIVQSGEYHRKRIYELQNKSEIYISIIGM